MTDGLLVAVALATALGLVVGFVLVWWVDHMM